LNNISSPPFHFLFSLEKKSPTYHKSPTLMKMISNNSYHIMLGVHFYYIYARIWWSDLVLKDHQQAPPQLKVGAAEIQSLPRQGVAYGRGGLASRGDWDLLWSLPYMEAVKKQLGVIRLNWFNTLAAGYWCLITTISSEAQNGTLPMQSWLAKVH
jgi:hypothetical protein